MRSKARERIDLSDEQLAKTKILWLLLTNQVALRVCVCLCLRPLTSHTGRGNIQVDV